MKKQFLLAGILILAGICFSTLNDSNLKACGTNTKACSVINKKAIKDIPPQQFVEDIDASYDMLMNPFTKL